MKEYSDFTLKSVDAAYVNALVELVVACRACDVKLDKVYHYQNGWLVKFAGYPKADAICHDGSYGSPNRGARYGYTEYHNDWDKSGPWESIGFPWDKDDVSVHSASELAANIHILNLLGDNATWDDDEAEDENEEEDEDYDDDVDESNYNPYMGCDEYETTPIDDDWF